MIDFSTLQGLAIPEGAVTQITDASGRVIWTGGKPVVLQVEKIISNTGAGETTYENEEFILLDIYPKNANSTVKVTYGGLTKTLQFNGTNAQQVYFGTFNGVSDSVATPESGVLTIEGGYSAYGCGSFGNYANKTNNAHAPCITNVVEIGDIETVCNYAFYNCNITNIIIPNGVTTIGSYAFFACGSLTSVTIPDSVTTIGDRAFDNCKKLKLTSLPSNLSTIGSYAFRSCFDIDIETFPEGLTSIGTGAFHMSTKSATAISMYGNTITFPSTVTSIGSEAFRYDDYSGSGDIFYYTYVKTAIMLSKTPPTIGDDAFGERGAISTSEYMTIIVPKGCGEAYKAAEGWSAYKNWIVEAS